MKFLYTGLLLFIGVNVAFGQTQSQPSFPIQLPTFSVGTMADYIIEAKVVGNNIYEYSIWKEGAEDQAKKFTLRPNSLLSFRSNATKVLNELFDKDTATSEEMRAKLDSEKAQLDLIFYQFVSSEIAIGTHDTRPVAGKLYFGKSVTPELSPDDARELDEIAKNKFDSAFLKSKGNLGQKIIDLKDRIEKERERLKKVEDQAADKTARENAQKKYAELNVEIEKLIKDGQGASKAAIEKIEQDVSNLIIELRKLRPSAKKFDKLGKLKVSYDSIQNYSITNGPPGLSNMDRSRAEREYKDAALLILNGGYEIVDVEIEFNEGFIENIKVNAKNGDHVLKFENLFPIGFSTKRDYQLLYKTHLFAEDKSGSHSIPISSVIERYDQKHEVDRRDYSPANETINFDYQRFPEGVVTLYKETTSKLFELVTFSDFAGFDQSSPNGLIQFEVEKRINLKTRRLQMSKRPGARTSYGFFQFITPSFLMSKLEENNKHLLIDTRDQFTNNQYDPAKFTSTLELKRYENFSVGYDLNFLMVDFPSTKLSYYFNSGFRYGRVAIRDSIRVFESNEIRNNGFTKEFGVDTYQLMPIKAIAEFKNSEKFSVNLAWSLNFYFLRDNYFVQVANMPSFKDQTKAEGDFKYIYHNIQIGAAFKPSSEGQGRLFFRYRYNWQQGYWRTGFHQAQVGYSVYLMKTLKPKS